MYEGLDPNAEALQKRLAGIASGVRNRSAWVTEAQSLKDAFLSIVDIAHDLNSELSILRVQQQRDAEILQAVLNDTGLGLMAAGVMMARRNA